MLVYFKNAYGDRPALMHFFLCTDKGFIALSTRLQPFDKLTQHPIGF
jgi:hypothetical protein